MYNLGIIKNYTGIVGYSCDVILDSNKPDGTKSKLLYVSKISDLDWSYEIELKNCIKETYNWFLENINELKQVRSY